MPDARHRDDTITIIKGPYETAGEEVYLASVPTMWDRLTSNLPSRPDRRVYIAPCAGSLLAQRAAGSGMQVFVRGSASLGQEFIAHVRRLGCSKGAVYRIDLPFADRLVTERMLDALDDGYHASVSIGFPVGLAIGEVFDTALLDRVDADRLERFDVPVAKMITSAPLYVARVSASDFIKRFSRIPFERFDVRSIDDANRLEAFLRWFGKDDLDIATLNGIIDDEKLYLDYLGSRERPAISPYVVKPSSISRDRVITRVNKDHYARFTSLSPWIDSPAKQDVNPLFYYEQRLRRLVQLPDVEFLTVRDVAVGKANPLAVTVTIRHDVDSDIVTAIEMAKLERRYGIATSYYMLHTSSYYGVFDNGVFHRNEDMAGVFTEIRDMGHEVSLHIDPLSVYQNLKIDGAQAVREEIRWLRANGIETPGAASHNLFTVYGAENYEVFKGVRFQYGGDPDSIKDLSGHEVFFKGKWAPLQRLDMVDLGLEYEGHEVNTHPSLLGVIEDVGKNRVIQRWYGKKKRHEGILENGCFDEESFFLAALNFRPGDIILMAIHPCYFGERHSPDVGPAITVENIETVTNSRIGWRTFRPGRMIAARDGAGGRQTYQSINIANEYGMISRPFPKRRKNQLTALVFGGLNPGSPHVAVSHQLETGLERLLEEQMDRPVMVRTFAFPKMTLTRYFSWYEAVADNICPDIVVLCIDDRIVEQSRPSFWLDAFPVTGKYIVVDNSVKNVELARFDSDQVSRSEKFIEDQLSSGETAISYLTACIGFMAGAIRREGAEPYMLVERSANCKGGGPADEIVEQTARLSRIPVIDPSPAIASWTGPGSATLPNGSWSPIGHRLAARMTADVIISQFGRNT